jgi:hypothetical protein
MKGKSIFAITLLVLCVISAANAWQTQPAATGPAVSTAQPSAPPAAPSFTGPPQGYGQQYPPAAAYPNQAGATPAPGNAQAGPTYPYPPYHNPYYDGNSVRNVLNGTVEWLFGLPGQAVETVSNFIDARFFPVQPATSGGQSQQAPVQQPPAQPVPVTPAPLPPASAYAPPVR